MAEANTTDLTMIKGDDFSRTITIKTDSVAQDITGWTVYFTIKNDKDDTDANAVYQQIITNHSDPTSGITAISIPHSSSEDFELKKYLYDIQTVDTADLVRTPVRGYFQVTWEITNTE